MQIFSPVDVAQLFMAQKLATAKVIIDATCGNGHDCQFLAENSVKNSEIYAFDIQQAGIKQTKQLLAENSLLNKVEIHNDNFVNMKKYLNKMIDLVVFNLGYLPGNDKNITSCVTDLREIIPVILELLAPHGLVVITSYPGHQQGEKEFLWLEKYLPELSNKVYNVGKYQLFNHQKPSPIVYIIEKV